MALNVYHAGSGEPPLVLIHGLGGSWRAWEQILPELTKRHEVLTFDLPGEGDSPALPDGVQPSVHNVADVVEEELDRYLSETPHLVGNSMGGEIALELARRGRARTVVAFSPSGMSNAAERTYILNSLKLAHRAAQLLSPMAPQLSRWVPFEMGFYALVRSRPWLQSAMQVKEQLETMANPTYRKTLEWLEDRHRQQGPGLKNAEEIRCPVLIAFGTLDFLLGVQQGPRFVEALPNARLKPLPGCGHIPMSDDPEVCIQTILDFIGEHSEAHDHERRARA
jgi:pimeloyl-ACP methyl ester carboxylesterase